MCVGGGLGVRGGTGFKAAETYVAQGPGANANTSSCSGQINCFLSLPLLFGLAAPQIGALAAPAGINETDTHVYSGRADACARAHAHTQHTAHSRTPAFCE